MSTKLAFGLVVVFIISVVINSCKNKDNSPVTESDISIIPQPVEISYRVGSFKCNKDIVIYTWSEKEKEIAGYFNSLISKSSGYELVTETTKQGDFPHYGITLGLDPSMDSVGDEGYKIRVKRKKIEITARSENGLFYAIQTLRQLFPPEFEIEKSGKTEWSVPCVDITDFPRFKWRGSLLDCCRHYMDKEFVKRYIDLLATHKMNRFHWHLTEDQGWRIEIKKYPKLTDIGAWRTDSEGKKYGGFYSQEDIKEIVAYAKSRYVEIIPEIEMPGHSTAALAAYPRYSCTGGPFSVETNWGVFKDIYCAGNDSTLEFLKDIIDEVIELFPSDYIHIGGDEAPKYRWENCALCQKRIKDNGLKDEHELQSWFITEIEKYLTSKNKKLIGWDEILEGGLAPSATVQSWRGMDGAIAAAKSGHDAIVSPTSHAYFDYDLKTTNLEKVYSFEPVPEDLSIKEAEHILGGECNIWTERAPQESIDSKVFPRILAMSEVLWSPKEKRDFENFRKRLSVHYLRLDNLKVSYGYESEPVSFSVEKPANDNGFIINLISGQKNIHLFYTLDGSEPDTTSSEYKEEIKLSSGGSLKVLPVYSHGKKGDLYVRDFVSHVALNSKITFEYPYSDNYAAGGGNSLIDGMKGTGDFRDKLWQGFEGNDMIASIDLGESKDFTRIKAGFIQSVPSWIFMPEEVEFFVSENGKTYISVGKIKNDVSQKNMDMVIKDFVIEFYPKHMQYIKVVAKNVKHCPDWHPGAGGKTWIFSDEIVVE